MLDVAKEAWEKQPSPFRTTIKHVQEMQDCIKRVMCLVHQHMLEAQAKQSRVSNGPVQPQEFQSGEDVHLLVPLANCKFLTRWQGPFTMAEQVSTVEYPIASQRLTIRK